MQKKIIIWVTAAFIMFNVTLLMFVLFSDSGKPAQVKLPVPNGYDDFVAGALKVAGNPSDFGQLSREQLAGLVATNVEALKLLRLGLSRECLVPIQLIKNDTNFVDQAHLTEIKMLAQLICAEGRLAELEGRTNDAATIYLGAIRFSQESCRGGLFVFRMSGNACERLASGRLELLKDSLDAKNCRAVVQALESINDKEEPVAETVRQEAEWSRSTGGFQFRIARLFMSKSIQKTADAITSKFNVNIRHRREMTLSFAARAYELEKGKPAQTAAELVPGYLKAIPKDPETGKELELKR